MNINAEAKIMQPVKAKAFVEACQDPALINAGYHFTVVVVDADEESDVLDLLDYDCELLAHCVAMHINNVGNYYAGSSYADRRY